MRRQCKRCGSYDVVAYGQPLGPFILGIALLMPGMLFVFFEPSDPPFIIGIGLVLVGCYMIVLGFVISARRMVAIRCLHCRKAFYGKWEPAHTTPVN